MVRHIAGTSVVAGMLLLIGCSDTAKKAETKAEVKKTPDIPTGPLPAFTAYYKMYELARKWSPDIQTASLTAVAPESAHSEDGKFPTWRAVFTSAAKRQALTYTYSTTDDGRIVKGISSGGLVPWAGPARDAQPFSNSEMKVDSDAAYTAAAEKAGDWLKKNADKPISEFALGDSSRFPAPVWYIVWGSKKNGFAAYVNATTGKVVK